MNALDRLRRVNRIYLLAGVGRDDDQVCLTLNNIDKSHRSKLKGDWVASLAQHLFDDDDPEQAVVGLEKIVLGLVQSRIRARVAMAEKLTLEAKELETTFAKMMKEMDGDLPEVDTRGSKPADG